MPSQNNILAGLLAFLTGGMLMYAFQEPLINLISYFPNELYVIGAAGLMLFLIAVFVIFPYQQLTADDRG